ncbi:hypothetical protein QFZ68_000226 [Streptomyces sp. V1I6]|nr:hypothetical protein [Streptomyces sp. V1I6]
MARARKTGTDVDSLQPLAVRLRGWLGQAVGGSDLVRPQQHLGHDHVAADTEGDQPFPAAQRHPGNAHQPPPAHGGGRRAHFPRVADSGRSTVRVT